MPEKRVRHHRSKSNTSREQHVLGSKRIRKHNNAIQHVTVTEINEDDYDNEFIDFVLNSNWKIHRLSPSNKISYLPVKLKHYAAHFRHSLVNYFDERTADNIPFDVKVGVINQLSEADNSKHMKIEVTQQKKDKIVFKYKGLLLHWDIIGNPTEDSTNYIPLLLSSGTVTITSIIHKTLQDIFDGIIRPAVISMDDVKWLIIMNKLSHAKIRDVEFFYYPNENLSDVIKAKLPVKFLNKLWNKLQARDSDEILNRHVEQFFYAVNDIFCYYYDINFHKLKLLKIVTPTISVSADGKVRLRSGCNFISVLDFLIDSAIIEV